MHNVKTFQKGITMLIPIRCVDMRYEVHILICSTFEHFLKTEFHREITNKQKIIMRDFLATRKPL